MARPTKYKKKYCKEILEFFDVPLTHKEEETRYYKGEPYTVEIRHVTDLPTFEDFARKIGVTMSTMWEWKQVHEEFSNAYAQATALQESIIVGNSITGRYVGSFSVFYLKNKHGYVDRQEQDLTTGGQPLPLLGTLAPPKLEVEDEEDGGTAKADDRTHEDM